MPSDPTNLPLLTRMADALPDGLIYREAVRDADGQLIDFRVAYINPRGLELTGPAHQKGVGTRLLGDNPDDRSFMETLFGQYAGVLQTGQPGEFMYWHPYNNRYLFVTRSKLDDGVLTVLRDFTQQHRTENAHRQQAELMKGMMDAAINGILMLEAEQNEHGAVTDFRVKAINRAGEQMMNVKETDAAGQRLTELFPDVVAPGSFLDMYRTTYQTGQPGRVEAFYKDDKREGWFEASAVPHDGGVVVTFLDTTEVRQALQLLQSEAALFETLSNNVPDAGVLVVNDGRRLLFCNGEVPNLFTAPKAAILDQRLDQITRPGWRDKLRQHFDEAFAGRNRYLTETIDDNDYDIYFGPVPDKHGEVVMVMATFRNVTRNRRFQRELEILVGHLQRSNQDLEQFAYVASHDLQEPLRKLIQFGDILANQYAPGLGTEGTDIVGRMQSAATRMQSLVRDVLSYSRLTAKEDAFQEVDMDELMQGVLVDLESAIEGLQAIVKIQGLSRLRGDAPQLRQLFQNLISNSLKFVRVGPNGLPVRPEIMISCRKLTGQEAPVPLPPTEHTRQFDLIEVTDNGIGFEQTQAERIFRVFERLHGRSAYTGTGIGLAIVQKVVENHRGHIRAEGRPGQGATFRILLPVASD